MIVLDARDHRHENKTSSWLLSVNVINECVLPAVVQLSSILQNSVVLFDNTVLMNYMFWQDGETPLHRASWNGEVDSIKILLDKGANIDHVDNVS